MSVVIDSLFIVGPIVYAGSWWERELVALFNCLPKCYVALSYGAVDWSTVCDCGIC